MKVESKRTFTPVTITVETREELDVLIELLKTDWCDTPITMGAWVKVLVPLYNKLSRLRGQTD
ncbi:MAG: hypothetical protein WC965_01280 [Thiohalomonadaceae bacterium]